MDHRLLNYYISRWPWRWPLWFVICLGVGGVVVHLFDNKSADWASVFLVCGILEPALFLFCGRQRYERGDRRAVRVLPLSARTRAETAWCEVVGLPLLLATCALVAVGWVAALAGARVWRNSLIVVCFCVYALSFSFLAEFSGFGGKARVLGNLTKSALVFSILCVIVVFTPLRRILAIQLIFTAGTVPVTLLTYLAALHSAGASEISRRSYAPPVPRDQRAQNYGTIGWWSAIVAHPFGYVFMGALCVVPFLLVYWTATKAVKLILSGAPAAEVAGGILGTPDLLLFIPIFLLVLALPWITSMRALGHLPISREGLALLCVSLPVVGTLPFLPFAGPLSWMVSQNMAVSPFWFLTSYSYAIGLVLLVNTLFLREDPTDRRPFWEKSPAGCLVAVLVVPLFVGFFAMWWVAEGELTCMAFVLPVALFLVIGSVLATYTLLVDRSEPYRPRTSFSLFSGGDEFE